MSKVIIKVDNVSKKFCKDQKRSILYGIGDISRNIFGLKAQSEILRSEEFWALDNVSFELKRGETLGIIGPNGSGKTTLLKLIGGILMPDKGRIEIRGSVGTFVELGAGFHPLLTGRENIYINGAILGMSKREIDERFDAIVDFAGIGSFLDISLKYYSSGMYVRLGFAIAAYCGNTDILLIDEVLAVGDMEFILKSYQEMRKYKEKGGTVIMVSHKLSAIKSFCKQVMWLEDGKVNKVGEAQKVCNLYETEIITNRREHFDMGGQKFNFDKDIKISKVDFMNENDEVCMNYKVDDYFKLRIYFECKRMVEHPIFNVSIFDLEEELISSNYSNFDKYQFNEAYGVGYIDFCIKRIFLKPSEYICSISFAEKETTNILEYHDKCYVFTVSGDFAGYGLVNFSPMWFLKQLS